MKEVNSSRESCKRFLRRIPLGVKILFSTMFIGISIWFVFDYIHTNSLRGIIKEKLQSTLGEYAKENRESFNQYITNYSKTANIIFSNTNFFHYLEEISVSWLESSQEESIKYYNRVIPRWMPPPSILNFIGNIRFAFLVDGQGQVREVYSKISEAVPSSLLNPGKLLLSLSDQQSFMTEIEKKPYIISSASSKDDQNNILYTLVLAAPFDNKFIVDSRKNIQLKNIVILGYGNPGYVLASNKPELFPNGMLIDDIKNDYLVTGKSFLDFGSSEIEMSLISCIPKKEFFALTNSIIFEERKDRAFLAFFLILSFVIIIIFIVKHIHRLTKYVMAFSLNELGIISEDIEPGDEIFVLEQKFIILSGEIIKARVALQGKAEELRIERDKAQSYLDIASVIIVTINNEGKVDLVNNMGIFILGYLEEEILGTDWIDKFILFEDQSTVKSIFNKTISGEESPSVRYVSRIKTKSGEHRIISWSDNVITNDDGKITGVISSGEDITEQKKAELEIKHNYLQQKFINELQSIAWKKESLKDILDLFLDHIVTAKWLTLDPRGSIFLVEDEPGVLVLKTSRGLSDSLIEKCKRVSAGTCVCGKAFLLGEVVFKSSVDADHENVYDEIDSHGHYCIPILSSGKEVIGLINLYVQNNAVYDNKIEEFLCAVAHDLANIVERKRIEENLNIAYKELKETQEQLIQSEKLASIGQLAAGIAHEINNPAGFVGSNIESLQDYFKMFSRLLKPSEDLLIALQHNKSTEIKGFVNTIYNIKKEMDFEFIINDIPKALAESAQGIERIRKIVLDLKVFARQEKGNLETIRIEDIIENVLLVIEDDIKQNIRVVRDFGNISMIKCQPLKMYQVFNNLIINAAQSIEGQGEIKIKTFKDNNYVITEISDTGKGIDPENLNKIFDPFFTTRVIGQGIGLGLSISYDIVKEQNGQIAVKSQKGKGTTFTVKLPVQN